MNHNREPKKMAGPNRGGFDPMGPLWLKKSAALIAQRFVVLGASTCPASCPSSPSDLGGHQSSPPGEL